MQITLPKLALSLVMLTGLATPALAQNYHRYSCEDLWVARNQIYKDAGYCFKTTRGIRYFGNAGCQYDNENRVPLSRGDRGTIDLITRIEGEKGCND
jgi:hypothetical protein